MVKYIDIWIVYLFLNIFLSNSRGIYKEQKADVSIINKSTPIPNPLCTARQYWRTLQDEYWYFISEAPQ